MNVASVASASAQPTPASLPPARMIGTDEVAELFRVSRSCVFEWAKNGRLPAPLKIGRKLLWRPDVIAAMVSGGSNS